MINSTFSEEQFNSLYDFNVQFEFWHLYRNNYLLKIINSYKLNKILDIGCGRGIVTGYLFNNGIKIMGVELGDTTKLKNVEAEILYKCNAFDLSPNLDIEVVTLFDVIEHIDKPIDFLKEIIDHFKNVRHILITVPARQELWSTFDEFNGHYKRYSLHDLDEHLEFLNCRMKFKSYFFHLLYFLIYLNDHILRKGRKLDYSRTKSMSLYEKYLHKVFAYSMRIERFLFPKNFKGSSILYLLEVNK